MNQITILSFCLTLLVAKQGINAINCYVCNMGTDGCGASFNRGGSGLMTTTTNTTAIFCKKVVVVGNANAIWRNYGTAGTCTEGSNVTGGVTYYQYCCTTDLCNEATMMKTHVAPTIVSLITGLLFIK